MGPPPPSIPTKVRLPRFARPRRTPGSAKRTVRAGALAAALLVFATPPPPITAQPPPEPVRFAADAFLDPAARELFGKAFAGWSALGQNVERYTARIDQRIAAALRTPLKDRVIYSGEVAVRAFWERDRMPVVQLLGSRARYPGRGVFLREAELGWLEEIPFDGPFAPGSDRLFIGTGEGAGYFIPASDDWLQHPLGEGADTLYRFQSGDTTTIGLPDGRAQAAVRLDVIPRLSDPRLISGTLWIDPASGALVRGAYRVARRLDMAREFPDEIGRTLEYRLVPGLLKPLTVHVQLVVVDYALWEFEAWMPRMVRYEGQIAAGVVKAPMSIDYVYRIESVTLARDSVAASAAEPGGGESREGVPPRPGADRIDSLVHALSAPGGVTYRSVAADELDPRPGIELAWIAPVDPGVLEDSPHLPPPIWEDAAGHLSTGDVDAYLGLLEGIPVPPVRAFSAELSIGWERPDLLRYNRVEGPAAGGALRVRAAWIARSRSGGLLRVRRPAPQGARGGRACDRAPPPGTCRLPGAARDRGRERIPGPRQLARRAALRTRQRRILRRDRGRVHLAAP